MPKKLRELRASANQQLDKLRALSAAIDAEEDPDKRAVLTAKFNEGTKAADAVRDEYERKAQLEQYERTAPAVSVVDPSNPLGTWQSRDADPAAGGASVLRRKGPRYAQMFGPPAGNDGWGGFNEFLATIQSGMHDPRFRSMTESSGPGGGYLIAPQYAAALLDASLESEIVRPRAEIWPMTTNELKVAGFDSSDNNTTGPYGFTAEWLGEKATATNQDAKTRKIELKARKLAIFASASNELAGDANDFEGQLGGAITKAIGWSLDYAFLRGTGAGQPRGVLNDPALITVDAESEQDADTLVYENLVKMFARLHPASYGKAIWVANPTVIPQLLTLSVSIGVGGVAVPVLQSAGQGRWQLLTIPCIFTEKLPVVGEKGDILLADFSQYVIGMRRELTLEKSLHILWQSDEAAYRAITRVDGQGKWNKAFTPKNGDSTSWCVALAAR